MSVGASVDYYRRREHQERMFAASAASAPSAIAHLELARRYAALVRETEEPARRPILTIRL